MKKIYYLLAICAFSLQGYAQPANDDCANAVELTVNPAGLCTSVTAGTLAGATDSGEGDNGAGVPNDDVWYTFVASAELQLINISNVEGFPLDLVHEVLEGTCGGGLTSVKLTDDPDHSVVTGLTPGNTYYLRIYSYSENPAESTTFEVCISDPPPPPANDDCAAAVELTVNPDNNCAAVTEGTLTGATDSGEGDNGAGTPSDDVWYTFVASGESQIINLLDVSGDTTDLVHEVLEGSCGGGLTSLNVSDSDTSVVTGLTVGNTYYVRVFSYGASPSTDTNFSICAGSPPPPPANDNCDAAIGIELNPDYSCGIVTSGTLSGATDSGEGDNGAGTPSDDVWYTFIATAESHKVSLLDVTGDTTDLVHEVLEGSCDGGLTSLNVSDSDASTVTGLTVGNTYYVRVFSYGTTPSLSTNFDICIGTPPAPPANDDCSAAAELTVSAFGDCTPTAGTLGGATDSGEGDNGNGTPNDDVWYTFVASSETQIISLSDIEGDPTYIIHEVLEGSCGGGLTSLSLSDSNTNSITGLNPGSTYYLRIFSYQDNPAESTTFNVCISGVAEAPANDDCTDAVELTVNPDYLCASSASGTLAGGTDSGEGSNGTGTPNDDVWYTFIATAETHRIAISNVEGDPTDLVHEILEGSCGGGLTSLNSSDPDTSNVTGLTPGNTYYVRVYSYRTTPAISTTFDICIGTPPPPPSNDECSGATEILVSGNFEGSAVSGSVSGATDSVASSGVPEGDCNGYEGGDVWFTAVVPASGNLTIETGPQGDNYGFDSVITAYSGSCDSLTLISCDDDSAETDYFSSIELTDLTAGETIYIRVYEYNNDEEEPFTIAAYDPSLSTTAFDAASFSAAPNPVTDILNLSYTKNISDIQVYNLLGQQVITKSVNNRQDKLDMSHLPSGTYLVKVSADGQTKTIKVLKK